MTKTDNYSKVIKLLQQLKTAFPTYNMGRHLSTALDGYGDIWGLTDKELLFALEKYKSQLELDIPHTDDKEIDEILKDGMDLSNILKEEDGEDY